ncbi:periplasmic binding protein/LacI transcriptional regulator [Thermoanaerobacterium xylanolyticum LX-11]|uniref:Periplasmic binding protein/LacI transcriptional regulator n=1 Tax=Thermoanaerobacterium xylanolyticum (strain ATCC 49914 / DSM 7097 / LX-11) TaxID=858215 RepID=F6BK17_THEXL|nr:substrate-binding domain-containing protein [Thermoanaerobacterium xylanolyticum]AEF18038.1 periplasmic binding protein/LacI transcriptional regulator [Thermoanaerobacterium xylanolyticum LX-11]
MKVKLRDVILVLLTLILIVLLVLLGNRIYKYYETNKYVDDTSDKNVIKIGFSLGTLKEERWVKDRDIFMAKAKELGAEVFVQNANNDDEDQIKQVKYLLDKKIDVLVIVPNDLKKASAAVEMAKKAGVKVISYDRLVLNSNVDLYISFDNVKVGKLMAEYLIKRYPKGNYLIINGATNDNNTKMLKEGYDSVLLPKVKSGDIHILGEEWCPNWMSEYAFQSTEKYIQENYKIDAIIAGDDGLANGIIEALSEHRLAGKVAVVAQDADLAACQRIIEGTQLMTIYKPIDKLAGDAAKLAVKLAKGEKLNVGNTIYDGKYNVPYYKLEPIAVDKTNIDDTVIKDGFHSRDDVYRYTN